MKLLTVIAFVATVSCSKIDAIGNAGKALIVDCSKQEVVKVANELGPLVEQTLIDAVDGDSKVDWDKIKQASLRWTAETGGCLLAGVVGAALSDMPPDPKAPKSSSLTPLESNREELRTGFSQFKAERFGGITFLLPDGRKL